MYNRALCLEKLGRTPEHIDALKEYLEYYPYGLLARNSVDKLNFKGDFEYRNHLIGLRTVTLKEIRFKPFSDDITYDSRLSLDVLGSLLSKVPDISIHIVSYQLKNKELAKLKARKIKGYFLHNFKNINSERLKLSWFDVPKKVKVNGNTYTLNETVDFITIVKTK